MVGSENEYLPHSPDYEKLRQASFDAAETKACKRTGSGALDNIALPETPSIEPYDLIAAFERVEIDRAANDAKIDAKKEAGLLTPYEAGYAKARYDNEALVAENRRVSDDTLRERNDAGIVEMAKENATTLARQAKEFELVQDRFKATGQNPFEQDSKFGPNGEKYAHERDRFDKAIKQQERSDDLFGSQQRAATTEYSHFMREQKEYESRIRQTYSLTARNELTLQKDIRAAEYLAYTSERIERQNTLLRGTPDNEISNKHRARAEEQTDAASELRARYEKNHYSKSWESENSGANAAHSNDAAQDRSDRGNAEVAAPGRPTQSGRGGRE